ncbi:hypothetical protein Mcup_0789 [Metallosphaera cuprina Ar-4]|uniref:Uncharacterized protein n=1 Tax=Metallosphaera cuprina (strain Ar-4) TaxID=1006006 RepID=F4G205_METCR|nr:hypothetical protein Mcup_0789 [Metallosphaera cuprina Ar-4]
MIVKISLMSVIGSIIINRNGHRRLLTFFYIMCPVTDSDKT